MAQPRLKPEVLAGGPIFVTSVTIITGDIFFLIEYSRNLVRYAVGLEEGAW